MHTPAFIKALLVAFLLAAIVSLGVALVGLVKDRGQSTRMVKALTWRIGLSLLLFALVVAGVLSGYVVPHGVVP